jgi:hypothetical protein
MHISSSYFIKQILKLDFRDGSELDCCRALFYSLGARVGAKMGLLPRLVHR